MKVIIAGGREFNDYKFIKESIIKLNLNISEIVSGKSKGVDTMGEQYALENNIPIKTFPANWEKHGRAAGPIRNKEMADYADVLISFWNGQSKGTKSMIELAKKKGIIVHIIMYQ